MSGYNEADDQTRDMREAVSGGTRSPYEAAYDIVSPSGKSKRGDRNLRRHAEHAPRTRGDLNLERVGFVTGPSLWKNPDTGEIPGHAAPRFYGDGGRLVKAGLPAATSELGFQDVDGSHVSWFEISQHANVFRSGSRGRRTPVSLPYGFGYGDRRAKTGVWDDDGYFNPGIPGTTVSPYDNPPPYVNDRGVVVVQNPSRDYVRGWGEYTGSRTRISITPGTEGEIPSPEPHVRSEATDTFAEMLGQVIDSVIAERGEIDLELMGDLILGEVRVCELDDCEAEFLILPNRRGKKPRFCSTACADRSRQRQHRSSKEAMKMMNLQTIPERVQRLEVEVARMRELARAEAEARLRTFDELPSEAEIRSAPDELLNDLGLDGA